MNIKNSLRDLGMGKGKRKRNNRKFSNPKPPVTATEDTEELSLEDLEDMNYAIAETCVRFCIQVAGSHKRAVLEVLAHLLAEVSRQDMSDEYARLLFATALGDEPQDKLAALRDKTADRSD